MGDGITPPDRGARRRVIWFVDNTVSLHSFIKGRASHAALDRAISMAKFLQARTRLGTVWGRGARARAPDPRRAMRGSAFGWNSLTPEATGRTESRAI